MTGDERPRLLTARFVLVVASGLAYFTALGILLPAIPLFVKKSLGGSDLGVGIAVGAFAVGSVVLRPWAGFVGDRRGRRILIIGGATVVAVSNALYHAAGGLPSLVAVRLLGGIGEAAFFVGAGTMVADLAPEERRGEAISYWSIAVYGGLAIGPFLGESLADGGHYGNAWTVAAALSATAAVLGCFTSETAPPHVPRDVGAKRPPLLHRAALLPGSVLFLGMIGLAGYTSFVALYARNVGMANSKPALLIYAAVVLVVRIVGSRVPDSIGPVRAGTIAMSTSAAGLIIIAVFHSTAGLLGGTVVFALGMSLLYPAMIMFALLDIPSSERGSAMGTVSTFFDLSQGVGAAVLGGVASVSSYRGAFVAAAMFALAGLVTLRWSARSERSPAVETASV